LVVPLLTHFLSNQLMMRFKSFLISILFLLPVVCSSQQVDVLIVGGGASGTTAGLQAARLGVTTLLVEETSWLGGMLTAAGVSAVDGNYKLPSGIFGEFRERLIAHYGSAGALQTGWVSNTLFEPSVGNTILKSMSSSESKLTVWYETKFISAERVTDGWKVKFDKGGVSQTVNARVMIDATELGDVAKYCGVKYDIGMEARAVCGEEIAPEVPNDIVQDLTYVMILKNYGVKKTIEKPANYDASLFYCSAQSANCTQPKSGQTLWSADKMMTYGKLPNGKFMINWPIEGNDYYLNLIEMTREERNVALEKAKQFSLCFLYYMQTELGFSSYGLADDEFPTADKLPFMPYHRESRRIHGLVRFNVNDVAKPFDQADALYRTGIAVGDYPVDHHHKRYPEWQNLPDLHFYPVPSYSLPLGALIPKDVKGLIVAEKSISVSNLLNGSTRLQPVVMQIGQAAGALAALSVKQNRDVALVPVRELQAVLLEAGGYLLPYLDLKKNDVHFKALQRIGATGILKGTGINVGWSNETWFYADNTVLLSDLKKGLSEFEPTFKVNLSNSSLTIADAILTIGELSKFYMKPLVSGAIVQLNWGTLQLQNFNLERNINRKEFSVLLDHYINPFVLKSININGKYLEKEIVDSIEVKPDHVENIRLFVAENQLTVTGVTATYIEMYNSTGQKVKFSSKNSIDTSGLRGLFIVKVRVGDETEKSIKVLI